MSAETQSEKQFDQVAALERSQHTKVAPGTEVLTDVESEGFIFQKGRSHIVLRPQPTAGDFNDPLVKNGMGALEFEKLTYDRTGAGCGKLLPISSS